MFCHHCGSQVADDAKACIHCGAFTAASGTKPPPRTAPPGMIFCQACGQQIPAQAVLCVHCGVKVAGREDVLERALFPAGGHSWLVALLLCFFGGVFGLHRFYVGKIVTGVLLFFTAGGLGVVWLIDLIRIALGGFTDSQGRPLVR